MLKLMENVNLLYKSLEYFSTERIWRHTILFVKIPGWMTISMCERIRSPKYKYDIVCPDTACVRELSDCGEQ